MTDDTLLTPLSIVLAFIGVIEATLAYRVTQLQGNAQLIFVWFMVGFPALVLAGFFYVQLTAPLSWYPPSELDKTNVERLLLLEREKETESLVSIELLGGSESRPGDTIATPTSKSAEALSLYSRGEYEEALKLFREVEQTEKAADSEPAQMRAAEALVNIGVTLTSLGRLDEAQESLEDALQMHERLYGPDHPATAVVLNNLATVYKNRGEYGRALDIYERVYQIQKETLGPNHPSTATSLNNLASVYAAQGNYGKAEPLLKEALRQNQELLGPEHPQTLATLNNLAYLYQSLGRYSEALTLYKRSLQASERVLGPQHPTTRLIRENLEQLDEK